MQAPIVKSAESASDRIVYWRRFFHIALRVLGLGLLASGIVTLIAANWDGLGKFVRIGGVQALLIAVVAVALVLVRHGRRRQDGAATGGARAEGVIARRGVAGVPPFAGALFLASVVTGGLLALLGQTYQTGADPWTLFGWWALLMLPWLWASRSWFVVVLWLVVVNTAVILLLGDTFFLTDGWYSLARDAWTVAVMNGVLLAMAEWLRPHYSDPYRVVPRLLALAVLVALFCTVSVYIESIFRGGISQLMIMQGALVVAVVVAGFQVYRRIRPDFFVLSQLAVFTVLYAGTYMLIISWLLAESLVVSVTLAFLFALGGLWGCVSWLKKAYQNLSGSAYTAAVADGDATRPAGAIDGTRVQPQADKQAHTGERAPLADSVQVSVTPASRSPFLFLFSFAFLFLLGMALVLLLEIPLYVAGVACLIAGLLTYVVGAEKWRVIGVTLMLASLLVLGVVVFEEGLGLLDLGSWQAIILVVGLMVLFHLYQASWFQFLCAIAALSMLTLLWQEYGPGFLSVVGSNAYGNPSWDFGSSFLYELAPVYVVLGTIIMMSLPAAWARRYRVLAWALLSLPMWSYLVNVYSLLHGFSSGVPGGQNMMVLALSIWRLPTPFPLIYLGNVLFVLLPVFVAWQSARRRQVPLADQAVVLLVLLALGVLWGNLPGVQLGLLFCVLGFELGYRNMLVIGVTSVILFLAAFYFQLTFLLLDKAYFLIGQGIVLLLVALIWIWVRPMARAPQPGVTPSGQRSGTGQRQGTPTHSEVESEAGTGTGAKAASMTGTRFSSSPVLSARASVEPVIAAIVAGLLAVLAVANTDVVQKEAIIRDGTRFIVALQPVDPRSLMQGDYMTLNFTSRAGGNAEVFSDYTHHYVELAPDAHGVYTFVRTLPDIAPPSQPGNVVVRYRRTGRSGIRFVTDAYFFPEGQGEHFARARFGEFRVNDRGTALLVGLLDEQQNRL